MRQEETLHSNCVEVDGRKLMRQSAGLGVFLLPLSGVRVFRKSGWVGFSRS